MEHIMAKWAGLSNDKTMTMSVDRLRCIFYAHMRTILYYCIQTGRPPVPISFELKFKKNSIGPVFIQPIFEGINRIRLYHIIRQTVPNINDPVTKRMFPYIISTHFPSQFEFIASGTTNRVKIKLYRGSGIIM